MIPQLNFSDIKARTVPSKSVEAIRRTGVAVIRGVVPKNVTEELLSDVRQYLNAHSFKGFPSDAEKKVMHRFAQFFKLILTGTRLSTNLIGVLRK
jgi:hypothetical protein